MDTHTSHPLVPEQAVLPGMESFVPEQLSLIATTGEKAEQSDVQ